MKIKFIKNAQELQTSPRDISRGFILQAMQKTEKAKPYINQAINFKKVLIDISNLRDLLNIKEIRLELASACGFSDKAISKLKSQELIEAIRRVLSKIYKNSNNNFKEEVVFRYLLTKGDSLGGSMRNVTGASAGSLLIEKIIESLKNKNISLDVVKNKTGKIQRLSWRNRVLLLDFKPKKVGKNIDLILLKNKNNFELKSILEEENNYLACGELKGGIDPAGADEHWKTANSALGRIRASFKNKTPHLFFVGAAIESAMAKEIFGQLQDGKLSFAANLNNKKQVNALVNWLISL